MRRKIIKQGQGGNTIFLPINWVRKQHLAPGDEVEVTQEEDLLIISGTGAPAPKRVDVHFLKTQRNEVRSVIASAYKAGAVEIALSFEETPDLQEIITIVNTFTGLEIVSQGVKTITIKCFLTQDPQTVEQLILKMFQTNNTLLKTLQDDEEINIKNFSLLRKNVQKIRDHCLRAIHSTAYGGDLSYDYYDLVTQLEKMSSLLLLIAQYQSRMKRKSALIDEFSTLFSSAYEAYLKKEFSLANAFYKDITRARDNIQDVDRFKELLKKESVFAATHQQAIRHLIHISSRLMSISLREMSE